MVHYLWKLFTEQRSLNTVELVTKTFVADFKRHKNNSTCREREWNWVVSIEFAPEFALRSEHANQFEILPLSLSYCWQNERRSQTHHERRGQLSHRIVRGCRAAHSSLSIATTIHTTASTHSSKVIDMIHTIFLWRLFRDHATKILSQEQKIAISQINFNRLQAEPLRSISLGCTRI